MTQTIGWLSSFLLVATIVKQCHKQWSARSSQGISKWLYIGQMLASLGFTVYSALLRNWVFIVTNVLMFTSALFGLALLIQDRRHGR